ncbi:MAG: DUF1109 family protein [Deltaproteobacteria bacterium]|jgi:hypothetical protein|nr:DUF1109 family protein [Deltaproteobacteria bacterium]MBW2537079.1 DUF1109 family protein [Deltaproteobacteria bacterium]
MSPADPHLDAPPPDDREIATLRSLAAEQVAREQPSADELERLRDSVRSRLDREKGLIAWLRALARWQRLLLLGGLAAVVLAAVVALAPRADLAEYPAGHLTLVLVLLAAMAGAATWQLLRPLHLPSRGQRRAAVLIGGSMAALLLLLALPVDHPGAPAGGALSFWINCLKCLAFGAAVGLPVGLVAGLARRSSVGGGATAALSGIAAGALGNFGLQLHCPITDVGHLLWGHAPLLVLLALVAAALSRRSRQLLE